MQHKQGLVRNGRLDHDSAELLYCLLKKKNPGMVLALDEEYREIMPPIVYKDFALIPEFIKDFCQYKNIAPDSIKGLPKGENMEHRKKFLAVLLLCYHPEKIIRGGITEKRTEKGLELYAAYYLNCLDKSLARMVPQVVTWLDTYPAFSEDVRAAHAVILEKHKDQPQSKVRPYAGFNKANTGQLTIF